MNFNTFIQDNFVVIIAVALFIIFTLIGFLADLNKKSKAKVVPEKIKKDDDLPIPEVEKANVGIADVVNNENKIDEDSSLNTTLENVVSPEDNTIKDEYEGIDIPEINLTNITNEPVMEGSKIEPEKIEEQTQPVVTEETDLKK